MKQEIVELLEDEWLRQLGCRVTIEKTNRLIRLLE